MPRLRVLFVPELAEPADLAVSRAVVVDVLRATTTIATALAAGARAVVPCLTVDDARRLAATLPAQSVVLGGERGGLPIEGFDLGNSPAEYTPSRVAGKTVVLTTTNGTKALVYCREAADITTAAFVNLSAACAHLMNSPAAATDVFVVCAGTEMHVSWDDVLLAGAITDRLAAAADWQLDDPAAMARDAWRAVAGTAVGDEVEQRLIGVLGKSRGGRNLIRIGMADDIRRAAAIDTRRVVPRYDPANGMIVGTGALPSAGK